MVGVLPMFHIYGLTLNNIHMSLGSKITTVSSFDPMQYLKLIEKNKVISDSETKYLRN